MADNLYRDENSGALIIDDSREYALARARKKQVNKNIAQDKYIETIEKRLVRLENLVRSLLKDK